ncbi:MAG TPA: hypothetical protein VEY07_01285, partial [Thermoplasmata archaeon]|nr:hypothetical protein [Thermoplasmata archaeon]
MSASKVWASDRVEAAAPRVTWKGSRLALGVGFWVVLLTMVIPSTALGSQVPAPTVTLPGPSMVPTVHYVAPGALQASGAPSVPSTSGLAGADPRTTTPIDGPGLAAQSIHAFESVGANPVGWAPGAQPPAPLPTTAAKLKEMAPPASPVPRASNIVTGNVTGFVFLEGTSTPVVGASGTVYSNSGSICPQVNCTTVYTTLNGSFGMATRLQGPVGADYIEVDYSRNLTNYSYITVYPHS